MTLLHNLYFGLEEVFCDILARRKHYYYLKCWVIFVVTDRHLHNCLKEVMCRASRQVSQTQPAKCFFGWLDKLLVSHVSRLKFESNQEQQGLFHHFCSPHWWQQWDEFFISLQAMVMGCRKLLEVCFSWGIAPIVQGCKPSAVQGPWNKYAFPGKSFSLREQGVEEAFLLPWDS